MDLREFVAMCITKAETAADNGDKEEAIRLLNLAISTIERTIGELNV